MWRCPKCRAAIRIFDARVTVICYSDGVEEEEGDCSYEWDDKNRAECVSCEWKGTVGETWDEEEP